MDIISRLSTHNLGRAVYWRSRLFQLVMLLAVLVTVTTLVQLSFLFGTPRRRSANDNEDDDVGDDVIAYVPRHVRPTSGGDVFRVAIGGAISSKGIGHLTESTITDLAMFWVLFPSFCSTASPAFQYHFYFGYDHDDVMANASYRKAAVDAFVRQMARQCSHLYEAPQLHLVECPYAGKPAWAQNDAMMEGYLDGADFFYRLNDDTMLVSPNWTEIFVERLHQMSPQYVGAVGPYCERGPLVKILTHDFVHRTHLEIFGYYYPRLFSDWYADNWITHVYGKDARSFVLDRVLINHTESLGKRYKVENSGLAMELVTNNTARQHHDVITRIPGNQSTCNSHLKRCSISIVLYGTNKRLLHGAVRNAQLAPLFYPGWKIRIYYHPEPTRTPEPGQATFDQLYVPDNVLRTLESLHAELVPITDEDLLRNPHTWRHLVFADDIEDELVFICKADSVLSEKGSLLTS